jgi:hypothetical protein
MGDYDIVSHHAQVFFLEHCSLSELQHGRMTSGFGRGSQRVGTQGSDNSRSQYCTPFGKVYFVSVT